MTEKAKDNLTKNRARLLAQISALDRVINEIAVNGTASATISAAGGSKSYTRLDLETLQKLRTDYADRVAQIMRRLANIPSVGIRRIMTVRY